ncbi:apolipoprotein N-acyltransferase [Vibrio mangrovi]|uniref:Apolipoprotein N-acyltransferase n=1 Tax=Vibrio mangrovi TaxID=474394 RepID=A0A1Y6IQ82_9VIBR|nr:apolipoprotein N-acyltransferase [Vibrio mangrovi]MDW6003414.1 apolipoprotein N-acyltransferase [Vibrio mangrovi]SMR99795.1 Apolipoprotein N-acyltransferase [Vibrio mangrovi]
MSNPAYSRFIRPLVAVFSGAAGSFAFAPYSLWPLAFLALYALLLLLHQRTAGQAFLLGLLWGMGFFGHGVYWIHVSIDTFGGVPKIVSLLLMLLLSAYLALYPALFSYVLNRYFPGKTALRYLLVAPALWLVSEWLRGWVFTGFPWLWLGYSQIDAPLANYAPLGGVELITLVIAVISASFAYLTLNRQWRLLLLPLCLYGIAASLNYVHWVSPQPERQTTIALVQGNIDQARKWQPSERWPTLVKYTDYTQANWDADIIIWPEAAIPAFEYELPEYLSSLDASARKNHSALITGILNRADSHTFYNSILALGQGTPAYSNSGRTKYEKHHLLPFGEFVPFEQWLRPLAPLFNLPMSSFSPGAYIQPNIQANGRFLVAALCYEIVFNEQIRENLTDQTDFLLTLSNDAWFGRSIGPLQHMEIARMRALELGIPLIRSTNNGVTAITDYRGKITHKLPQFEAGVLKTTLTPTRGKTPYRMFGSWPLYCWIAFSLLSGLLMTRLRR